MATVIIPEMLDQAIDEIILEVEPHADPRAERFDHVRAQLVAVYDQYGSLDGVSIAMRRG